MQIKAFIPIESKYIQAQTSYPKELFFKWYLKGKVWIKKLFLTNRLLFKKKVTVIKSNEFIGRFKLKTEVGFQTDSNKN